METRQIHAGTAVLTRSSLAALASVSPHWVLVFGSVQHYIRPELFALLREAFPEATLVGCSTAGEIGANGVTDGDMVITAVRFRRNMIRQSTTPFAGLEDSRAAGKRLAAGLSVPLHGEPLRHVLLFGPGVNVNGTALVDGLSRAVDASVVITGGLAGDGGAFRKTWLLTDAGISDVQIVAIGFYGDDLTIGHGSFGGWQLFGPARKVTRAQGSVLYALDGEPALDVYSRYLGEYAAGLPASGLLFPLAIVGADHAEVGLIRTILGVDFQERALFLAGEVAEGGFVQMMHASTDALVDGAGIAAEAARTSAPGAEPASQSL